MSEETRIQLIGRLLKEGKTNEEIIALAEISTVDNLYKLIQLAGFTIESVERIRRVAGRPVETVIVSRKLVHKAAATPKEAVAR